MKASTQEVLEYAWLQLGDLEGIDLSQHPFRTARKSDLDDPAMYILRLMRKPEYFPFTCKHVFNVDILPFQHIVLKELWTRPFPMLIASRGASKSWMMALYSIFRSLFTQGSKVIIVGSSFRQSKVEFEYCENFWANAPVLRDLVGGGKGRNNRDNGPRRDIDRCELIVGDSIVSALPLGDGCLVGTTQVTFQDGFGVLGEEHGGEPVRVRPRERWLWGNGGFVRSDEAYANGLAETRKITTHLGLTIEGTLDHRIRVLEDGQVCWKRFVDIRPGDRPLVDITERWHDGRLNVSEDEAYSLGLMIGDGCWTGLYSLGYASQDDELVEALRRGTNLPFRRGSERDPCHYQTHGRQLRRNWLERWGLPSCYAHEKFIPKTVLGASKEAVRACIQGIFDTDGHLQISTRKGGVGITIGLTSTSQVLVDQIQYILLHFGIVSQKRSRQRGEPGKWRRVYELLITGGDSRKFAERVGFRLPRKQQKLEDGLSRKSREVTSSDEIPGVKKEMLSFAVAHRMPRGEYPHYPRANSATIRRRKLVTRKLAQDFLGKYQYLTDPFLEKLSTLADKNVFYDTVVAVEEGLAETFDLHVPGTHEYCANGFFSHNTRIRGQRSTHTLCTEFASIPVQIFETVVAGFGVVSASPAENVKSAARVRKLKEMGLWTQEQEEERRKNLRGNQIVLGGTAYYDFNHFAQYWRRYKAIVESRGDPRKLAEVFEGEVPDDFDWRDYSVIRIPIELVPDDFMDMKQVTRSKLTISNSVYACEYSAVFVKDSDGFFRRTLIESCVVGKPDKPIVLSGTEINFHTEMKGVPGVEHIFGVDPASERDNFSVVIVALHPDHRRIVYCWTTTRALYKKRLKAKLTDEHDFYAYCAKKIRSLMRLFPCKRILMDAQGGGIAVMEAFHDPDKVPEGEMPIWEVPDPDPSKWKDSDDKPGWHLLELVQFARADWVSEANHGMKKDFGDKILLFPHFDPISVGEAMEQDKQSGRVVVHGGEEVALYDTLEDAVMEIEELKDELATIVHSQTSGSGREHWDTPEVKLSGGKKGRARKDRYSGLLMANMGARQMARTVLPPAYTPQGGWGHQRANLKNPAAMYVGPEWFTQGYAGARTGTAGAVVRRDT